MIRKSAFAATVLIAGLICLGVAARLLPVYANVDQDTFSAGEPGAP